MRFFGVLFLGVCFANVAESDVEIANPPKETKASVDARLALVAVCPEETANCSVPTGPEAENEELADALDCMLKVNITAVAPGPCRDVLEQFLQDHLNPANRIPLQMGPQYPHSMPPQFPMSPTMLIMRSPPGPMSARPSPLAEIFERMAANSGRPPAQPMMFPFGQDPRRQPFPQNPRVAPAHYRGPQSQGDRSSREQSRFVPHGDFPRNFSPMDERMAWRSKYEEDRFDMREFDYFDEDRYSRHGEQGGHWDYVWHSDPEYSPRESYHSSRESYSPRESYHSSQTSSRYALASRHSPRGPPSHRMPPPPPHRMPPPPQRMPSHRMSPRMSSHMSPSHRMPPSQRMPPPPSHMGSQRMSPAQRMPPSQRMSSQMGPRDSSSSGMNPMMMMMLPRLMSQGSSQNPMSGLLMASMMKNMASSSGDDYDYDYGYDYDNDDYDYDYDYVEEPSPSPMASMIQQMIQQKLAARQPVVQVSLIPALVEPVEVVDVTSSSEEVPQDSASASVEIQSPRPRNDKEMPSEQVSYRSAP